MLVKRGANHEISQLMRDGENVRANKHGFKSVVAKTLEYDLSIFPVHKIRPVGNFLERHFQPFDRYNVGILEEKKALLNTKLVGRYLKRGKILSAYEAFWGTWNPKPAAGPSEVYMALGGNKRPAVSTLGAFTYSGAVTHGMHPLTMPVYMIELATNHPGGALQTWLFITGFYIAAGLPIVINKSIRNVRSRSAAKKSALKKSNDPDMASLQR